MTMKHALAALVAAVAMALPAVAQEATDAAAPAPPNTFIESQPEAHYLARDVLIGAKVQGDDGKIIGDIEDVILNDWNRVQGVVMGTGGFLGVAEKRVGVQLGALEFQEKDGKRVVVLPGVTQATLNGIPEFQRSEPKKSLLERAMEKARELTDKGTETTKSVYEKAKEQAGPTYEKAKDAAGKAYESTKDAATKAYESTKEAAGKAYERAKEAAGEAMKKDEGAPATEGPRTQ